MRRNAVLLLLLIAAAGAGYLAGSRGMQGSAARAHLPARGAVGPVPAMPSGSADAPHPAPDPAPATDGVESLRVLLARELGEAPEDARVTDAAARAEKKRRAYVAAAENAELEAAREVAQEIRHERAFLQDRARGGTMELLRKLDSQLPELVGDEKRFGGLFDRQVEGSLVHATSGPIERLADGMTISYPPGVHELRFPRTELFPKDILVQGSGMDATLLRFAPLSARSEVASLTFRDMTIDCQDSSFANLRAAPATIRLERCRVVGFDNGAGGSVMLDARAAQAAFYATDCRFEAGYGRSPGFGNLFRVRAGLVRLERCLLKGPFRSIYDGGKAATFVFAHCDIRDAPAGEESAFKSPPAGVRFVECTFSYVPRDAGPRSERRPLSDLNPDWPAK